MKKTYLKPIVNTRSAQPTNLLCESFYGNGDTGLTPGGGSNGEARTQEWNIWDEGE